MRLKSNEHPSIRRSVPALESAPNANRRAILAGLAGSVVAGALLSPNHAADAAGANNQDYYSVKGFGAKGDGHSDDTPAFQSALETAGAQGGIVYVPPGDYAIRGTLKVPQSVSLAGSFQCPPRTGPGAGGSVLLAYAGKGSEAGEPFISLATNSTLKGISVFYPEQTSDVIQYPPTVQGSGDDCSLVDVALINPYFGIDFGTHPCGRHWIKSVYMQALRKGIYVAECFDVGRIEDIHIWPFWRAGDPKVDSFTSTQGEAFVLARTDWEYMANCFCIGYGVGYRFTSSASGPGNVVLTQCGSDEGPKSTSVLVEQSQAHAGVSFVNSQFMGVRHVDVAEGNAGPVKFTACGFWGMPGLTGSMAALRGKGQVTFTGCHFTGWALAGDPYIPAIDCSRGGLLVSSCDFMDVAKRQIRIHANADSAVIVANRFRGGQKVESAIADNAQIDLNATT